MTRYAVRRLGALLILLLVLSALLFGLRHFGGGDPVRGIVGANASQATIAATRHRLGLDQSLTVQYVHYLGGLLHGDLGDSYRTRRPVSTDIRTFLPATVELVAAAFALALVLAVVFAVSSVLRWKGAGLFRGVLLVGATAPTFLLAIGGVVLFAKVLGWLPASGRTAGGSDSGPTGFVLIDALLAGDPGAFASGLQHLVLPAVALAVAPALAIGRVLRSGLLTTLGADHVRTARSKGLTETRTLRRHVLRNSLGPALSMAGLQLGFTLGGVLVVENVFNWDGLGSYLGASIPVDDYPAIAGVTLVLGASYVVINAVVDLLQAAADPRVSA
jgi:peptide/nickel transport system permease protein